MTIKWTADSVMSGTCFIHYSGSHVPPGITWMCRDEKHRQLTDQAVAAFESGVASGSSVAATNTTLSHHNSPFKTRPEVPTNRVRALRQNITQALSKVSGLA